MNTRGILEFLLTGIMSLGILLIFIHRIKRQLAFGARASQSLGVVLIVPGVLILALEGILSSEATAALVGAIAGYLFSGIGEFKSSSRENEKDKDR